MKLNVDMDLSQYAGSYYRIFDDDAIKADLDTALDQALHGMPNVKRVSVSIMHYDKDVGTLTLEK